MPLTIVTNHGSIGCEHDSHETPVMAVAIVPVQINGTIRRFVAVCDDHFNYGERDAHGKSKVVDLMH